MEGIVHQIGQHAQKVNPDVSDMADAMIDGLKAECFHKKGLVLKYNAESDTFTQVELGSL